jgi:autotransporter-associated beta strand protein
MGLRPIFNLGQWWRRRLGQWKLRDLRQGFSVGGTGSGNAAITNVSLVAKTLANLGGAGINGAGLTMNGVGTLMLDGSNTYTGPTNAIRKRAHKVAAARRRCSMICTNGLTTDIDAAPIVIAIGVDVTAAGRRRGRRFRSLCGRFGCRGCLRCDGGCGRTITNTRDCAHRPCSNSM